MSKPIELPFPPSVNALWRAHRGRQILSKPYRDWKYQAGMKLVLQRPERHTGPVAIHMDVALPDKKRRDLDNLWKPCLDLLVAHQIIERDDVEFVRELSAKIGEGFEGVRIQVTPL